MKKSSLVALAVLPVFAGALALSSPLAAFATAPAPTSHWSFDGNTNDEFSSATLGLFETCPAVAATDPCNDSTSFAEDSLGGYMNWTSSSPYGGGFDVTLNGDIGASYSFGMTFAIDEKSLDPGGYTKLVDYRDRGTDTGFYFLDGETGPYLNYYDLTTSDGMTTWGETLDIVAVRDASGAVPTFTVYVRQGDSFAESITIDDPTGEADPAEIVGNSVMGFFDDDTSTSDEGAQAGRIYDLKMWQGSALTLDQINESYPAKTVTLANTGFDPVPLVAAGLGAVAIGLAARRFSRR